MYILLLAFWSSGWNSYLRTPLRKFSNLLRVFGAAVVTPSGWKLSSSEKIDVAITTILIKETSQPWQWRRITFHLCWRESSPSGFQDPQKPPLSLHPAFRLPPPCLFLYPAKKKYWPKKLMPATTIMVIGSIPEGERKAHTHSCIATSAKCTGNHDLFFLDLILNNDEVQ